MTRILVTGGCGFIGSYVMRELLHNWDGAEVKNIDVLTYAACKGTRADWCNKTTLIQRDLSEPQHWADYILAWKPHYIIHLAAESHVDRAIDSPDIFMRTNVQGTFELLKVARQLFEENGPEFRKFVHVSTDEVYGPVGGPLYDRVTCADGFREYHAFNPRNPYAASKAAAEHLVQSYHHTYGLPTVITRGCNTYGPWQTPEKLVPLMILKAMRGEKLPVYGDGQQEREWMHAEDHAKGIICATHNGVPGEVYNLGTSESWPNLDVVMSILIRLGSNVDHAREQIAFVTDRPGHDRRYAINPQKARDNLSWEPKHRFLSVGDWEPDGLSKTVDWYTSDEGRAWIKTIDKDGDLTKRRGS